MDGSIIVAAGYQIVIGGSLMIGILLATLALLCMLADIVGLRISGIKIDLDKACFLLLGFSLLSVPVALVTLIVGCVSVYFGG